MQSLQVIDMEFQKDFKNISFGFGSGKAAGITGKKEIKDILINAETLLKGENSAYKGIGCISGNNSSRLLLDYKALYPEVYSEIMRILFEKGYGAQLSHIKLELGADINSSSGTEPCTMRYEDEIPDVTRGAGFIFAADALKINPDITVDFLRWGQPAWVADAFKESSERGFEARYKWYSETIKAAYNQLGIKFTHISPDANETGYADTEWLIYFSERIKSDKSMPYDTSRMKIVASDEVGTRTIADEMLKNERLRNAVDIIGLHYTTYGDENTEKLFTEFGKEIWYSEGIAPSNIPSLSIKADMSGFAGRCGIIDTANRIINSWYSGKMTMYEYQPAVASYYDGSCYYPKHILKANEPWSGHYEIGAGLYMTMHFTRFIGKNWHPAQSGCFGDGTENHYIENTTANYVTMMSEDKSDFTTVITNDSCTSRHYRLIFENCDFSSKYISVIQTGGIVGSIISGQKMLSLERRDAFIGKTYEITVAPYSIVTITTLDALFTENLPFSNENAPDRKRLTLPYSDEFSCNASNKEFFAERGNAPLYTTDQGGAFELSSDKDGGSLKQIITKDIIPENWRFRGTPEPITCLGDDCWANYSAGVTVKLDGSGDDIYAGIGVRYNSAVACEVTSNCGCALKLYGSGSWEILFMDDVVSSGVIDEFDSRIPHKLSLSAAGNLYLAYADGVMLGSFTENETMQARGRVSLLSSHHNNQFTGLYVKACPSLNTYCDRADALSSAVVYTGNPELKAMESYKFSNRTKAVMHEGDGFSTEYHGCGFNLCGTVGEAHISIELDGKVIAENKKVGGTEFRQAFYRTDYAPFGWHRLKVIINSGEFEFDSLGVYTSYSEYSRFRQPIPEKAEKSCDKRKLAGIAAAAAGTAAVALILKSKKKKKR